MASIASPSRSAQALAAEEASKTDNEKGLISDLSLEGVSLAELVAFSTALLHLGSTPLLTIIGSALYGH